MAVYEVLSLATRIAREMQGEMMISARPYTITHFTVGNQGHDPQDRYNALSPDVNMTAPTDEVITPQKITSAIPYDTASGFGPTWICSIPAGLATGVLSSLYLWADMAKPQTPGFPVPPQVANLPTTGTRGQTCEVLDWGYYQWSGGSTWALQSAPPSVTSLPLTPAVGQTVNLTLPDPPYAPGEYVYDGVAWVVIASVVALPVPAPFVYDVVHLQGVLPAPVPSKYVWDEITVAWVNLYLPPVPRFVDLPTVPVPVIGQRAYVIVEGAEYFWNQSFWEKAYDRFLFAICNMPELIKLAEETDEYHVGVQF